MRDIICVVRSSTVRKNFLPQITQITQIKPYNLCSLWLVLLFAAYSSVAAQTAPVPRAPKVPTLTLRTQPQAQVWVDEVWRGTTDDKGQLAVPLKAGRHVVRVRATGYREVTRPLLAVPRAPLAVRLGPSQNAAELVFQQAEIARAAAQTVADKQKAAALYRRALQLRARYAEAHVGLARLLSDLAQYDDALAQIDLAQAARPGYAEAAAVEGRIYRAQGDDENAVAAFQDALRAARNNQPEAHTGLALLYAEKGQYAEAVAALEIALSQLYDTEPLLYQLLGENYEKLEQYAKAVAAYEKYLVLAPDGKLAPAIRSTIDQLRRQAADPNTP